ncbi:D-alanyl-D-alanine carboxypeptidase [Sphingomonas sp. BE138]|uniref:D-alanyl-D-alanine carboxypeptidase family protein n=1 Tax=Sphingomonas sp. BE138 TaxID=2817845 RepID=UPI00286784D6|nr:D-alanyl-D-alanine carboxypeptidase family protein [Sphingomonas sp. BE138]MDR6786916.1 D-alanyl-D-alanine carboxypeptidase [Sphingomonas sp. BE138]
MSIVSRVVAWGLPLLAAVSAPSSVDAAPRAPVSDIVMDAGTGEVLESENADRARPPASLAKMMTLLLAFEALDAGELKPGTMLRMTAAGERQQPSRLGLRRGRSIRVDAALRAVAVISANDIAVAIGDRLAGSERAFVARMNARARAIGMTDTRFGNATGLAPSAGRTTARDMAILARHLIRAEPRHYRLFSTRSISWEGRSRPNHNKLLGKVAGLDGLKTGYTVEAGFNLAASAKRGARRVIVVVMGAPSASERDLLVANLMEVGFSEPRLRRPRR